MINSYKTSCKLCSSEVFYPRAEIAYNSPSVSPQIFLRIIKKHICIECLYLIVGKEFLDDIHNQPISTIKDKCCMCAGHLGSSVWSIEIFKDYDNSAAYQDSILYFHEYCIESAFKRLIENA